jgi:ATP-dependent helicase Lhr and Lhr-like helicase
VVIDELHSFLDNVRGIHLRSLLARLEQQATVAPRRLGLSATLGDFAPAKAYLHPADTTRVTVLEDDTGQRDLRISVKAYFDADSDNADDGTELTVTPPTGGLAAVAEDIAQRFRQGSNLVFCNRRQDAEVLADKLHHIGLREHWPSDPFILHHGSLSRELREEAEQDLKSGKAVTALCTSTLEMGIDLGSVRAVGQVEPPWSVASLVQRLGRSGRKEGQAQVLRLYALDAQPHEKCLLPDRLYRDLIRAIAMVELHLEKWLEPPAPERRHYSTCLHQTFSILKQTGGTTAVVLHERLIARGAFQQIKPTEYAQLLRGLAEHELIEQMPDGTLILAPKGERIVESRDFYAAFMGSEDYTVEHEGIKIGLLPRTSVPPVKEHFLLAGKRWRVIAIEPEHRLVIVAPAKGWKRPVFTGQAGDIHPRVLGKMHEVLASDGGYAYLDTNAAQRLAEARAAFTAAGLHRQRLVQSATETLWLPWTGSAICLALQFYGRARGLTVSWDGLALRYEKVTPADFAAHCQDLASQPLHEAITETLEPSEVLRDRFDELVPPTLLKAAFIAERLDLLGAQALAKATLPQGTPPVRG